jgi:hypothetical protein
VPVAIEFRSRRHRVALKLRHRVAEVLECVSPEFFGRAVFRVVRLGVAGTISSRSPLSPPGARFDVSFDIATGSRNIPRRSGHWWSVTAVAIMAVR